MARASRREDFAGHACIDGDAGIQREVRPVLLEGADGKGRPGIVPERVRGIGTRRFVRGV